MFSEVFVCPGGFLPGGVCPSVGVLSRGVSIGRVPPDGIPNGIPSGGPPNHKSGWYAFYWNAFLFYICNASIRYVCNLKYIMSNLSYLIWHSKQGELLQWYWSQVNIASPISEWAWYQRTFPAFINLNVWLFFWIGFIDENTWLNFC